MEWCKNIFLRIYYSTFLLIQTKNKMNKDSWIAPGIIISCKQTGELCKELDNNNNNNATVAYCYTDCFTMLSVFIKRTNWTWQINSKLPQKIKNTCAVINKESLISKKKRIEIQTLNLKQLDASNFQNFIMP